MESGQGAAAEIEGSLAGDVLIVDDDPVKRYVLARFLRAAGYLVREAANGAECWEKLAQLPDLIVLDVKLPDISGFELCLNLRTDPRTREVPILYASATIDSDELRDDTVVTGADGYLRQPLQHSEAIAQVRSLVRLRRAERRLERELEEKAARARLLDAVSVALGAPQSVANALETVAKLLVPQLADWSMLATTHPDGSIAKLTIANADPDRVALGQRVLERHPDAARTAAARALETGQPQLVRDILNRVDELAFDAVHADGIRQMGLREGLAVPLLGRQGVLGVLHLNMAESGRSFTAGDIELAGEVARRAATAVEAGRLYEELELSRSRLSNLTASGLVGIFYFREDGRITTANDHFLEMVRYSRAELEAGALNYREMTPPSHQELLRTAEDRLHSRGVANLYEKRYLRKDGSTVDVEVGGAWFRDREEGVAVVLDISARKAAEERLSKLNRLSEALGATRSEQEAAEAVVRLALRPTRAVAGSVVVVEEEQLRIVASFGYPEEALDPYRSLPLSAPIPIAEVARTAQPLWIRGREELKRRWPVVANDVRGQNDAFAVVPLVVNGRAIGVISTSYLHVDDCVDEERDFLAAVANLAAQTLDRGRLFDEERRATAEARRIAELQQRFMGVLGHDLRNPLQAVTMAAAALTRHEQPKPEIVFRSASRITASARRMGDMIRDLLDLTAAELGAGIVTQPVPMDLARVVHDVVDELSLAHTHRLVFEASGNATGTWDPGRIAQVASNLVANAIKYGDPDSPVTVKVSADPQTATLCVHNFGKPIPEDYQAKLFEAFWRPDQNSDGVGLGLYIVRQLVQRHGGTVGVTSSEEAGTEFRVMLPRTSLPANASPRA